MTAFSKIFTEFTLNHKDIFWNSCRAIYQTKTYNNIFGHQDFVAAKNVLMLIAEKHGIVYSQRDISNIYLMFILKMRPRNYPAPVELGDLI